MANTLDRLSAEERIDSVLRGLASAKLTLLSETRIDEDATSGTPFHVMPVREALIRGRTGNHVTLYWRLFYDRRADGFVLWLEAQARPEGSDYTSAPMPTRAESINDFTAEDILHTMQLDVRQRMIVGVQALLSGRAKSETRTKSEASTISTQPGIAVESQTVPFLDGNLWATGDGKIFMWSTAERGDESSGYTIRLRDGATAAELVDEALQ